MPAHRKDVRRKASAAPPKPPGAASFLDRWPLRRKLDVLVIVPLTVVAALLAYVAHDQIGQARTAADTARLVRDSTQVARLIDALQTEHRQALLVSLRYEAASGDDDAPDTSAYAEAQEATTARIATVREAFGPRLSDAEAQALKEIEGLESLRTTIEQGPIPADNIDPAYGTAVDDLIDGLDLSGPAQASAASSGNLLDALLRADTAHASFETSVFSARTGDPNALIEYTAAVGNYEQYVYQAGRFTRYASTDWGAQLASIQRTPYQNVINQHYAALQVDPSSLVAESPAQVRAALAEALRADPTYERQSRSRLKTTQALIREIADQTDADSAGAWARTFWLLVGALVLFTLWLAFSVMARRSVVRTVRAVTGAALRVSAATGEELARVADEESLDEAPPRLEAVPVPVRDEIGELAEAFNRVQDTATALLERQVLSRRNIAEMFGNVGRRVSNLTARQLALIDAVERGETDPAVLERLYRIDHIAVRLQRNADSLMLLAGIRETGLDGRPTPLSTVVRAALGQIEAFQRVRPRAEGDVTVSPDVIGDLTLMLAELLENAVTFSPASSRVDVVLRPPADLASGDVAVIEIIDHGLGMSAERLAEENARLVRRERLDLVPTKVLGLFVVGMLSRRWGIGVTLGRTPGGGVTSTVVIPAGQLLDTDPAAAAPAPPPALPEAAEPRVQPPLGRLERSGDRSGADGSDGGFLSDSFSGRSGRTGSRPPAGARARVETPPPGEDGRRVLPRRVPRRAPETPTGYAQRAGLVPGFTPEREQGRPPERAPGRTPGARPGGQGGPPGGLPPRRERGRGLGAYAGQDAGQEGAGGPSYEGGGGSGYDRVGGAGYDGAGGAVFDVHPGDHDAPSGEYDAPSGHAYDTPPGGYAAYPPEGGAGRPEAAGGPGTPRSDPANRTDTPHPLRRRVRGATLSAMSRNTAVPVPEAAAPPVSSSAWRPADADAARSDIDEFEAAEERARRDSAREVTGRRPAPPRRPGTAWPQQPPATPPQPPEGVDQ